MKKCTCILVSLILVLTAFCVTGCGSNEAKAKEYMKKGDDLSTSLEALTKNAKDDATGMVTALGLDLMAASAGEWESSAGEVEAKVDQWVKDAKAAKAEYEKILALSGVEEYKKYAELRIKALDNLILVLNGLNDLIDVLGNAISEGKSLKNTSSAWFEENKDVMVRLGKCVVFWGEAALYKSQKKLGDNEEAGNQDNVENGKDESNNADGTIPKE